MKHLSAEELIDLMEGTRSPSSAPHLDSCEACRRQLAELRAVLSATAEIDVPEPSPLFWEHLSARIREAVAAAEASGPPPWFGSWPWPRIVLPLAGVAVATLVIVALVARRGDVGLGVPEPAAAAERGAMAVPTISEPLSLLTYEAPVEASLGLMVNLTEGLDFETARDAGLTADGSAEHAVTHLSDGELTELQGLLRAELVRPGV